MRNNGIISVAVIALLSQLVLSCGKSRTAVMQDSPRTKVCFRMNEGSKAGERSSCEERIDSFVVFVFDKNGSLDVAGLSKGDSLSLEVALGADKTVCVIANHDEYGLEKSVSNINDLYRKVYDSLSERGQESSFAMSGVVVKDITEYTKSIVIKVRKLQSLVSIEKIVNELGGTLVITRIYMSNVPSGAYYFEQSCPSATKQDWLTPRGREICPNKWLSSPEMTISLPGGTSTPSSFKHYFYVNPNYTAEDSEASLWCPRHTRIVIQTQYDGQVYWYPLSLNARVDDKTLKPNNWFRIRQLTIKHIGSVDPDAMISPTEVDFDVTVTPWGETSTDVPF